MGLETCFGDGCCSVLERVLGWCMHPSLKNALLYIMGHHDFLLVVLRTVPLYSIVRTHLLYSTPTPCLAGDGFAAGVSLLCSASKRADVSSSHSLDVRLCGGSLFLRFGRAEKG